MSSGASVNAASSAETGNTLSLAEYLPYRNGTAAKMPDELFS